MPLRGILFLGEEGPSGEGPEMDLTAGAPLSNNKNTWR